MKKHTHKNHRKSIVFVIIAFAIFYGISIKTPSRSHRATASFAIKN